MFDFYDSYEFIDSEYNRCTGWKLNPEKLMKSDRYKRQAEAAKKIFKRSN